MASPYLAPPQRPLTFDPNLEQLEENEAETQQALIETLLNISHKTHADTGQPLRSVHAKSHGILRGELAVLPGLPPALAQGIFAEIATYPVVIRFSTTPGDILDDKVSTPRGMAIKLIGVAGDRLPGSEGDVTQDFVLVNGPVFNAPSASKFLSGLKLLASTTDKAERVKKVASTVLRGAEVVIEAFGTKSPTITSLGGHPLTHLLGETFFSQVPLRFGQYVAKIQVAPVSDNLQILTGQPIDLDDKPNGLREAVVDFFSTQTAQWEVRVQLCTNVEDMPIEDASVQWSEADSPYVPVARITALPQDAWSETRIAALDEGLAFSPWHGITAHQPLGSIMRVRRAAYAESARFRAQHSGVVMTEPKSANDLPD